MPLLEVVVLHQRDAAAAAAGEADRLLLIAEPEGGGRTPDPALISAVVRETELPVRVLLRPDDVRQAEPGALSDFVADAARAVELGAAGFSVGFLDRELGVDRIACAAWVAAAPAVPWTFDAIDQTLVPAKAWRALPGLVGLDSVYTAGSARGGVEGGEELLRRLDADPWIAEAVLADGGSGPALAPWLIRRGVRQFRLGAEARIDRLWQRASVDAAAVRAWRLLLDDAAQLAAGEPTE